MDKVLSKSERRKRNRLMQLAARFRGLGVTLTVDQYLKLQKDIGGKCGICGAITQKIGKSLALDHCHVSKKIRGFLCSSCNSGLGMFKDDKKVIKNAIEYLKKHK